MKEYREYKKAIGHLDSLIEKSGTNKENFNKRWGWYYKYPIFIRIGIWRLVSSVVILIGLIFIGIINSIRS